MAFWITFALYAAVMLFIWGYFIVARLHVFKFKDYSRYVEPVTRALAILLLVLTIAGLVAIFRMDAPSGKTVKVSEMTVKEEY